MAHEDTAELLGILRAGGVHRARFEGIRLVYVEFTPWGPPAAAQAAQDGTGAVPEGELHLERLARLAQEVDADGGA